MLVVRQATTALCDGRGEEKVEVFGDADDDDGGGDDAGIAYRAYEGSLQGIAYGYESVDGKMAQ